MVQKKYIMSFTAGALFHQEAVKVVSLYLDVMDWAETKAIAFEKNLLQARTTNSARRIMREICSRLECLHNDELILLQTGFPQEQAQILWLAICRRYSFIYDFAVGMLREKHLTFQHELLPSDYEDFFNDQAILHEELEQITVSTRAKLKQVLFRMLREADFINIHGEISPAILSERVVRTISTHGKKDLAIFPVDETSLKEWYQ